MTQELSSMVAKIFQNGTDHLYRIYPFEYVEQQLKMMNLFFIYGCQTSKLIYNGGQNDSGMNVPILDEKTLDSMQQDFGQELQRLDAFMDGAVFYMKRGNFPQAAFMLHQYMEIWYRNVELLVVGKERKSHSIKEHQTYIKDFSPELGRVFNMDRENDRELVKLLDHAYIGVRYLKNYHITKLQLETISEKAWHLNSMVAHLYGRMLESTTQVTDIPRKHIMDINSKNDTREVPIGKPSEEKQKKIIQDLRDSAKTSFVALRPFDCGHDGFRPSFLEFKGYTELFFTLKSMINVCILASQGDLSNPPFVKNPGNDVQQVLGLVNQLLPMEEWEFLDECYNLLILEPQMSFE
jgi:HEPN domain-containing protein